MNLRSLVITLALTALAVFALMNWSAFTAPTTLHLGFGDVQAPLGLIMLMVTGLLCALFLLYIVFQQAGVILEARRYAKELKSHRELADKAEASRFTEMQTFLERELRKLEAQNAAGTSQLGARLDGIEQGVQDKLAEMTRVLSAYVGEVDDKLDRMARPPAT